MDKFRLAINIQVHLLVHKTNEEMTKPSPEIHLQQPRVCWTRILDLSEIWNFKGFWNYLEFRGICFTHERGSFLDTSG